MSQKVLFNPIFIVPVCLTLCADYAWANLRAPYSTSPGPSTALYAEAENLTVAREDLLVSCELDRSGLPGTNRCTISATYYIEASEAESDVVLQFVAPTSGELSWALQNINHFMQASGNALFELHSDTESNPEAIRELFAGSKKASDGRSGNSDRGENPVEGLHLATFQTTFNPGINTLEVRYDQLPGVYEYHYGYFISSRFEQFIDYEIWPIKEWNLSQDFELNVEVEMTNAVTGWWSRLRSRQDEIWITTESDIILPQDKKLASGKTLIRRWSFLENDLPDRIRITTGPYESNKQVIRSFQRSRY